MMRTASNVLIVDAYNANPTSVSAALDNLDSMKAEHKAVMLGNMLELGPESVREHEAVLARLSRLKHLDVIVLVGDEFRKALDAEDGAAVAEALGNRTKWFATSELAASFLQANPLKDCCILIKGSRGSRMENVVPEL